MMTSFCFKHSITCTIINTTCTTVSSDNKCNQGTGKLMPTLTFNLLTKMGDQDQSCHAPVPVLGSEWYGSTWVCASAVLLLLKRSRSYNFGLGLNILVLFPSLASPSAEFGYMSSGFCFKSAVCVLYLYFFSNIIYVHQVSRLKAAQCLQCETGCS